MNEVIVEERIKTGVVGLGRAGWNLHFERMLERPGFEIVAVADAQPERVSAAREKCGCATFANLDELLAGADLDLVVIATPSHHHFDDARKVLKSGRHCLLEKPMCMSFSEARELLEIARVNDRQIFVHHLLVHGAELACLQEILASGKLGEIFHVRRTLGSYNRRSDWQTLRKNGGGILANHGSHMLSTLLPLLGAPVEEVSASMRQVKDAGDTEDHAQMLLRTSEGVTADLMVSSSIAFRISEWLILGRNGSLISDGRTVRLKYFDPTGVELPSLAEELAAKDSSLVSEALPWREEEIAIDPALETSFHDNVHAVLTEGALPLVSAESALEVVRVSELALQSAESEIEEEESVLV